MTRERSYVDVHERKQRQRREDRVQLVVIGDVEYADLGVPPRHSPKMPPFAGALQYFSASLLLCLQFFEFSIVEPEWNIHIHPNTIEHRCLLRSGRTGAACPDRA